MKTILILASSLILLASCSRDNTYPNIAPTKSAYIVLNHNDKPITIELISTDIPYGISKLTIDSNKYILVNTNRSTSLQFHGNLD